MNEPDLESVLSLVPLEGSKTNLVKPIKFFDPDAVSREWPKYDNPLWEEINRLDNKDAHIPFYILSATKTKEGETEKLELKGEYKTFDDLTIEVNFRGVYGDPEKNAFLSLPLKKEDSFWSFDLEARVIGADARQEKTFSLIGLRDSNIYFFDSNCSYKKHKGNFAPTTSSGFDNIRKIGKIVAIYEQLHIRELIKEIFEKKSRFEQELAKIHFSGYNLELKIMEFQGPDDELDSVVKHIGDVMYEFRPVARMKAIKKAIKKDNIYIVTVNYDAVVGQDEGVWSIDMEWPGLMEILNNHQRYRVANLVKLGSSTLPDDFAKLCNRLQFVMDAFGFVDWDTEDSVTNSYVAAFDHCILDAREKILQKNPRYKPLYSTYNEANVRLVESLPSDLKEGILRFRKKEDYAAFEMMAIKAFTYKDDKKKHKRGSDIEALVKDHYVQVLLGKDPQLKYRVMTFYKCYRKNPENANKLFNKLDPAYVLGEKLYEKREAERENELKKSREPNKPS